jgi:hypothetical protein
LSLLKRSIFTDFLAVAAISTLITLTVYSNEARKDVIYLCSNIHQGVSKQSVEVYLSHFNLLSVDEQFTASGSKLTASSWLHFWQYKCIVRFGGVDQVLDAEVI